MIRRALLCAALVVIASAAQALDLPGAARLMRETVAEQDSYAVPIGSYVGESVPVLQMAGGVLRQAWQVQGNGLTAFQIIQPLHEQLLDDGYRAAFDCDTDRCGGFDFRFGIDVLPAPYMFVNLRQFHYTTMLRGPEGAPTSAVMLLASTTQDTAYLQVVEVSSGAEFITDITPVSGTPVPDSTPTNTPEAGAASVADLLTRGSVVLEGLEFETGATTLGAGPFQSLADLAAFLGDNPDLRIVLVGHTDSVGALEGNISISRQRAQAVRQRLIDAYGVAPARLDAEGMGYLAPRASNLSPEGREINRRVEAIVLTGQ